MSEQPPPRTAGGFIDHAIQVVKGLTLRNVLTLSILLLVLVPTYLLWRIFNDAAMLGKILSSYEEVSSDKMPCTLKIASLRGAGTTYGISTGFAYQGSDRWVVSVLMDRQPTDSELQSYCETLNLLIDFMRDPNARSPTFPGTEDPMVHMYPK